MIPLYAKLVHNKWLVLFQLLRPIGLLSWNAKERKSVAQAPVALLPVHGLVDWLWGEEDHIGR